MGAVMEAVIERASEDIQQRTTPLPEAKAEKLSSDETHPIPSPTVPLPKNPRPDPGPEEQAGNSELEPEAPQQEQAPAKIEAPENPLQKEVGKPSKKSKSGLSWADKLFRS